ARREVDLVVENDDVLLRNLEEARGFADGGAALVHVGLGLQEQDALAADLAVGRLSLELALPGAEAMRARDGVRRHETDVVAVAGVLAAGIAETDEQLHG